MSKQVAQRGDGCSVPGDNQGQAGQCSDLAIGVSDHCGGVGLDGF